MSGSAHKQAPGSLDPDLKAILDQLYTRYNHRRLIPPDPLQFVYRYDLAADREVVGFLASALAYGRVEQITRSLEDLLGRMGEHPSGFVLSFGQPQRKDLRGFRHRFTTGTDLADLLEVLGWAIRRVGSLEALFLLGHDPREPTLMPALERFTGSLLERFASQHGGRVSPGLGYLLSRPSGGSACKRLNLFLRWMVRRDNVDPGPWTRLEQRNLVVPLDVHMVRLCRMLGLHSHRSASLSTAIEVTGGFARIEPDDPVKYDFSLCRLGMKRVRDIGTSVAKRAGLSETNRYIYSNFRQLLNKETDMKRYRCLICGYIYNPEEGDPDNGIEAGTSFDDLPEDWVCPDCGVGKDEFEAVDDD
jgi:uncharacterized protein (TIGR02757 family)